MTNTHNTVLYIGVTNSLKRRISEHNSARGSIFTSKYNCGKLVYYETFPDIRQAIAREKCLKRYQRLWKNDLVDKSNPEWQDLGAKLIDDPSVV